MTINITTLSDLIYSVLKNSLRVNLNFLNIL